MVVEFGNAMGTHFALSKEYPESGRLLRSFLWTKHSQLRVHEHLDRSFVSAITGSARLKDRLQLAQTKSVRPASARLSHHETYVSASASASPPKTMTSGRTSPKRCRPVSAGPTRSTPKTTTGVRTIRTSRSVFPAPPVEADGFRRSPLKDRIRSNVPAFGSMAVDSSSNNNNNNAAEAPATSARSSKSSEDRPEDDLASPASEPVESATRASGAKTQAQAQPPRRAVVRVVQRKRARETILWARAIQPPARAGEAAQQGALLLGRERRAVLERERSRDARGAAQQAQVGRWPVPHSGRQGVDAGRSAGRHLRPRAL
ncbi:hypothetical protein PINS_up022470 [Pythium insidiosum]|nr:hypothetical protein PINS_up022470 [Pythium insidiosum]